MTVPYYELCYFIALKQETVSFVTSIIAAIASVIAIIVAIGIAKTQKNISLLENRIRILNAIEDFVNNRISNWEWNGSLDPIDNYSKETVRIFFDEEFSEFFEGIKSKAKQVNILIGNIEFAKTHGTCHDKLPEEIETEIHDIVEKISADMKKQRDRAYRKWIKI